MASLCTQFVLICSLVTVFSVSSIISVRYEPNWSSLDSRPLPVWYDESKIGIFLHWGVFSVPGLLSEWFWRQWVTEQDPAAVKFMQNNYKPDWTYQDFAEEFTASLYKPDDWAELFNASGARYVSYATSLL